MSIAPPVVALFDMDRTLIDTHTAKLYVQFQRDLGEIGAFEALRTSYWLLQYTIGVIDAKQVALHVLQGYRMEDGQLTAWSLGNFVFDGFSDPEATQSVVLTVQLDREGLTDTEWTPVHLEDSYPQALDPDSPDGRAVLEHLESLPSQR